MAVYSEEFGSLVSKALGKRSYRQVAPKAGVSPSYIGDMVRGRVPTRGVIVAFAEAVKADRELANRLLFVAGYLPVSDEPQAASKPAGAQDAVIQPPIQDLRYEPDMDQVSLEGYRGADKLTPSDRRRLEAIIRAFLADVAAEQGREGG